MGQFGNFLLTIGAALPLSAGGCVRRVMHVQSDPPGALVTMNDQEVGRTPFTTDFTWYGKYDVQVRKEGYQTLTTRPFVVAPWWQWPPFDLVAEVMPWHPTDERNLHFSLTPEPPEPSNPNDLLNRAKVQKRNLESSVYTHPATTRSSSIRSTSAPSRNSATTP